MSEEKIVHIIPIGFEIDRILYGLIELAAKDIYLLYDEKKDNWGNESRKFCGIVKERLKLFHFNINNLHEIPFDPTTYKSCEETLTKILEKEKNAKKIYINISTSTKLCAVASTLKALQYDNTFLYYVVPERYNLPPDGLPFSSGAARMEVFSPRGFQIGDIEKEILIALERKNFISLGELNKTLIPEDVSKASRAKLSYYIRKLQREGYVEFIPGKKIQLTQLGRSRFHPPTDDAKTEISSISEVRKPVNGD